MNYSVSGSITWQNFSTHETRYGFYFIISDTYVIMMLPASANVNIENCISVAKRKPRGYFVSLQRPVVDTF